MPDVLNSEFWRRVRWDKTYSMAIDVTVLSSDMLIASITLHQYVLLCSKISFRLGLTLSLVASIFIWPGRKEILSSSVSHRCCNSRWRLLRIRYRSGVWAGLEGPVKKFSYLTNHRWRCQRWYKWREWSYFKVVKSGKHWRSYFDSWHERRPCFCSKFTFLENKGLSAYFWCCL